MKYYLIVSGALLIAGCTQQGGDAPKPPRVGIPNPASVYCEQKNGTLVPVQTPQGVRSDCKLPSGEVVDEWTLWRRDHPAVAK